jgi:hypothetical protein
MFQTSSRPPDALRLVFEPSATAPRVYFYSLLIIKPHTNLPSYPSVLVRRTCADTESEGADEADRSTAVNSAGALLVCS